ncbi:MAG: hypothetical protein JKY37_12710 [Nannocystaceae bacterium]|nr:hypothetical protein [Nannocystaceae bacterium]
MSGEPPESHAAADSSPESRAEIRAELREVQRLLARERLSLDEPAADRTCLLSHVGAQPRLTPCAWVAHRDLLYAMALSNLNPSQRRALANSILLEYHRDFGVGHLKLRALPSGLPLGGASLEMQHRRGGPRCLYTWALGPQAEAVPCDWLLLRAQPGWALDKPLRPLSSTGLSTLVALGGEVVVLVATAVAALQVARLCAGKLEVAAHPRFSPYIEGPSPEAPVLLWPHDALDGAGLRRRSITAVALVAASEGVRQRAARRHASLGGKDSTVELVDAACPARIDRAGLTRFWEGCGRPRILLRGDPQWAATGARWLEGLGAHVEVQGAATQLSLL